MTDLATILPDFPTKPYSHLIPSLDRHGITVADLLSLDALEIARRATLPILDLRRLAQNVVHALQDDLNIGATTENDSSDGFFTSSNKYGCGTCKRSGTDVLKGWDSISILDPTLDEAIGGGIPTGYVTEITGERWVDDSAFSFKIH